MARTREWKRVARPHLKGGVGPDAASQVRPQLIVDEL